ncbi:MAG: FHA domain-containing protein [Ancrocorticia sp.]|uniref:FHA domain-containing protein n=1 Tax=Ancrocorticia sp. TaxID=2593684 RepID=UPI003F8DF5D2
MSVSDDPNKTSLGGDALGNTSQYAVDGASADFADDRRALRPEEAQAVESLPHGSALLIALSGPNEGARFLLNKDVTNAGRQRKTDIFLDDFTVSRRHAQFVREGNVFTVRDSGSLNGTYVNRERIDSVVLANGDEVQIGKFRLSFYASQA